MKITSSGGGNVVGAVARARSRINHETDVALHQIGSSVAERWRANAPVESGAYRDSIGYSVAGDSVSVGAADPQAHIVERGRQPGRMPPPAQIQLLFQLPDSRQAYLVARAIGQHGTEGHAVADQTRSDAEPAVTTAVRDALERIGRLE